MNKDVEKIRTEIKRRIAEVNIDDIEDWRYRLQREHDVELMKSVLSFIESMQKEPEFKVGDTLRRKSDGCHAKVIEVRNDNVRVESTDWDMWILNKEWELVKEPETTVWHDNKDTPVASKTKIVLYTNGKWDLFKAYKADNDFDNYWANVNQSLEEKDVLVKHWAYVDDLLTLSNLETTEKERKCMYSKDDYTDEDRKVLCDGCKEECEYSKSGDFTKALAECIMQAQGSVVDPMVFAELWKDELIKLSKGEKSVSEQNLSNVQRFGKNWKEPVSEDLKEAANAYAVTVYNNYLDNPKAFENIDADTLNEDAFKAGAKWQKQQIKKSMDLGEPPYLISVEQAYYRTVKLLED